MGFDAALRATHDGCGLGDVQLFPITQQKRLPLTLGSCCSSFSITSTIEIVPGDPLDSMDPEVSALSKVSRGPYRRLLAPERGLKQRHPRDRTFCLRRVANCVLQDPLEKHRQLCRWLGPVLSRKLEHGVLHYVEGVLRLPDANSACLYARRSTLARNSIVRFGRPEERPFLSAEMTSAGAVRWYQSRVQAQNGTGVVVPYE